MAKRIFHKFDPTLKINVLINDGAEVKKGDIAFIVEGKVQSLLQTERLVLNVMQRMSGIATTTHKYVKELEGTNTRVLDTRKTTPGMRMMEKEAFENADALSPYPSFFPTKGIKSRDQAVFRKAASAYPLPDTERIIKYLGRMDERIKNSAADWTGIIFSVLLSDIILRKGDETRIDLDSSPLEWSL